MIVTFYSFKGGVGRSMAMANVARWLERNGLRVVVVDWDLEAPGLESFFINDAAQLQRSRSLTGLMDLLSAYMASHAKLPWPLSEESRPAEDQDAGVAMLRDNLPPLRLALQAMAGSPRPNAESDGGAIWLLSAGARDGEQFARYANSVQSFDWSGFYDEFQGETFFEWLRAELNSVCDIALVDSRTGVTEMGGICTRQLADVVVGLCAPNEANLAGTERLFDSMSGKLLNEARRRRKLELIPIPARVDRQAENNRRNLWRDDFVRRMTIRLGADASPYWDLQIPYVPYYSFEEKLVIGETDSNEELERAYLGIGLCIAERLRDRASPELWQSILMRTGRLDDTVHDRFFDPALLLEGLWQKVPADQQATVRRLVLRLVQLFEHDPEEVKCRAVALDLLPKGERTWVPEMSRLRLLRQVQDGKAEGLQLARDEYVQWPRLREWLREDREFLLWRLQLESAASAWSAAGEQSEGALLSSDALAKALFHASDRPDDMLPLQLAFIRASKDGADRSKDQFPEIRRVFIIRGFGAKRDSAGLVIDFERVHEKLIAPALQRCGLSGGTTGEAVEAGNIRVDMFALILEADLVICDISVHNASVFYELGVRHALRKKHTLMIKAHQSADTTPFDLLVDRYLAYSAADPGAAVDTLVDALRARLSSDRETDSPAFLMMPALLEVDPFGVTAVPPGFIEEIERAARLRDSGLVRVIAEDLQGERFQWEGLRRVARAQWSLRDFEGARRSWETLRRNNDDDLETNLALANVYERLYRKSQSEDLLELSNEVLTNIYERQPSSAGSEEFLESSNQAIRRIGDAKRATPAEQAEALALQGRNLKTMWRARFSGLSDPAAVRQVALDARALQSYGAYRKAFYCDLNAFYPGVAALQMGYVLLLLSASPNWRSLFKGNKKEADRAREDLVSELPALAHVVQASLTRAREQLPAYERLWADIADADLLFLTMPEDELQADPSALVEAYRDAIPANALFAWAATRGQLTLFAQLGLRAEAVQAVLDAFDPPAPFERGLMPPRKHLVVFTGHGIDVPGAPPRFPARAEDKARALIADRLKALQANNGPDERITVLASAAPGADILVHELCDQLQLPCRLCLPLPPEAVAQHAFAEADRWRSRFVAVVQARQADLLLLSIDADLPRWLQGRAGIDPWERGNRWVMQLAQTWGAERVTLLALWDGQDDGRNGGTAQMVRMAKASGHFQLVDIIDSRQLLA